MMKNTDTGPQFDGTAAERVEHVQDPALELFKHTRILDRIDPRDRYEGTDPVDDQDPDREQDTLLQLLRLGEGAEIHVRSKLFSS